MFVRVKCSTVAVRIFSFPLPITLINSSPRVVQFHYLFTWTLLVPIYKLTIWIFSFSNFLSSLIKSPCPWIHALCSHGQQGTKRDRWKLLGFIFNKQNNCRTATAVLTESTNGTIVMHSSKRKEKLEPNSNSDFKVLMSLSLWLHAYCSIKYWISYFRPYSKLGEKLYICVLLHTLAKGINFV